MANEKDDNKWRKDPVNYDRIAEGEKKTIEQTLADGKQGKREDETHVQFLDRQKQEAAEKQQTGEAKQEANKPKVYQDAVAREEQKEKQNTTEPSINKQQQEEKEKQEKEKRKEDIEKDKS